jgi:hypothetical protein
VFEPWTGQLRASGPTAQSGPELFGRDRTFWLFVHQVLLVGSSCKETVANAAAWIMCELGAIISTSTAAYCQARRRLSLNWLGSIVAAIITNIQAQASENWLWLGRQVWVVDGCTLSMPDTRSLQKLYPQPRGQKRGCGFPVMRLVVSFSLATGALVHWARGSLATGERVLFHKLWKNFRSGDVILADRGFCSFADYYFLCQRGIDCVMRLHSRRSVGLRQIRRLGRGDYLVDWVRSNVCPDWVDRKVWRAMPQTLRVRHVTFRVEHPGFRTDSITVATTLLDPHIYSSRSLAELYRRRWNAELFLRDIKISMGMDVLRCKSAPMVHRELLIHVAVYNLVRAMMMLAAKTYPTDPTRLSFKATMGFIRQWAPVLAATTSRAAKRDLIDVLLYYIAQQIVPYRPNRVEPRALKRRPKNYQRLTQPRHEFREIKHRNRYLKPAA